jgi:hypothetical protein
MSNLLFSPDLVLGLFVRYLKTRKKITRLYSKGGESIPKFSFEDNPLINKILKEDYVATWALRRILGKQVGGMP